MADLSGTANDTYVGGQFYMMWHLAGDGNMICGGITADHATNDTEVIICPLAGVPNGVTALQATVDIDTALTDGVFYEFYSLKAGTVLRAQCEDDATASFKGDCFIASNDGDAGMVEEATTAGVVVGYLMKTIDVAAAAWLELIT